MDRPGPEKEPILVFNFLDASMIWIKDEFLAQLTLVATALFFHVISWPQVKCDLGREMAYPFSPPPHRSCHRALNKVSIDTISFIIVFLCCLPSWQLVI
jgi:hypothetical protein